MGHEVPNSVEFGFDFEAREVEDSSVEDALQIVFGEAELVDKLEETSF